MIKAGRLDRRIDIQRKTLTQSGSGAPVETWTNVAARHAASYSPLRGDERNSAPQWVASQQVEFWVRWSQAVASVNPKDRIIYPAIMDDLSPEDAITEDRIFDIMEVLEIGRREGLKIRAVRRADL